MKSLTHVIMIILLLLTTICFFSIDSHGAAGDPLPLSQVRYWAYQIQGLDAVAIDKIVASHYDMVVVDPTVTHDWDDFDAKDMVLKIKASEASDGVHRKLVIAYIDIGEAEEWRWYWYPHKTYEDECLDSDIEEIQTEWAPWVAACDPDGWAGNYPVAFWDEDWKDIVIDGTELGPHLYFNSLLDEVVKDGFDGVYLDWVEVWEMGKIQDRAELDGKDPDLLGQEMLTFIQEIRAYGKLYNPDFLVIQQNSSELICEVGATDLKTAVDAIAQEGVWWEGDATDDWEYVDGYDKPSENEDYYLPRLRAYKGAGLPVFVVEYAKDNASDVYLKAKTEGFIAYATRRSLSELTDTPPDFMEIVPPPVDPLLTVRSWAYQLQGPDDADLDLDPLQEWPADLVVVDYSRNGGEDGEFLPVEIQTLKDSGKLVLSYMAIGSANVGRFYDQDQADTTSPFSTPEGDAMRGPSNEDFPGTFYVKFWFNEWQDIIFGDQPLPEWVLTSNPLRDNYLERVLAQGFDGVYLDDIDVYQQFNQEESVDYRPTAALEMVVFIQKFSAWAKVRQPGFLVFVQNGENLFNDAFEDLNTNGDDRLDDSDVYIKEICGVLYLDVGDVDLSLAALDKDSDRSLSRTEIEEAYFNAIDALGAEDFFFKGEEDEDNPFVDTLDPDDSRIDDFKFTGENFLSYRDHGLPIFNVEYLVDPNPDNSYNITKWFQYCRVVSDDFEFTNTAITTDDDSPAFTSADLHSLTIIPFHAPKRDLDRLPSIPTPCVIIDPVFCPGFPPRFCIALGEFQVKVEMAWDQAEGSKAHLRKALRALIRRQTGAVKGELEIAQILNAEAKILVGDLFMLRNLISEQLAGEKLGRFRRFINRLLHRIQRPLTRTKRSLGRSGKNIEKAIAKYDSRHALLNAFQAWRNSRRATIRLEDAKQLMGVIEDTLVPDREQPKT